jgi:hypothetical protein
MHNVIEKAFEVNQITSHGLKVILFAYIKDEDKNISIMITIITYIVSCKVFKLITLFIGSCWGLLCLNVGNMQ